MIQIHYFLGKNEETTLCWLWSFFCLLGMCLQNRQFHQVVLFIDFVAAVWISGFLSFFSLDKQTRARMHRWWWWWWGGGGGWREGSALEEGDCTPWSARGFLWLSKPCFQAGSMTVWQGSGHYCAGPLCTMPMGMRSHMLGVGECRHCGLGLKTAFIQQSVNCAHNRCLRRCISVWLVYHLDWILQSLTHISKGKGRDSCLGLW